MHLFLQLLLEFTRLTGHDAVRDMMGTVTTTHFKVNGKKVDLFMRTDDNHKEVHITNYN